MDDSKFVISYIGNLKANQNPQALWRALVALLDENPSLSEQLELNFTGRSHADCREAVKKNGLQRIVYFNDYVPHHEAIRAMRRSAALLFIIPRAKGNEGILTGKLFDYLAAGRPFLAIGPTGGDAAKILLETNAGEMLDYENEAGIKSRISRLFAAWQKGKIVETAPRTSTVKNYERSKLTGELAKLLDETQVG